MKNATIKENAESTSRTLVTLVYYVYLLICILALFSGAIILIDELEIGLIVIAASIIFILFITLTRALFDTFINISEKLDYSKHILAELQQIERSLKNLQNTQSTSTQDKTKIVDTNKQP